MTIKKKNLKEYLLTLQLITAGYSITYDEVQEDTMVKAHLDGGYRWYLDYTMTWEQSKIWYTRGTRIAQRVLNTNPTNARKYLATIDLAEGLQIKG